jgi:hypothetical protein
MPPDSNTPHTPDSTGIAESMRSLREQRDEALRELGQLSDDECRLPGQWSGVNRSINFLLRTFAMHEIDHIQHAQKLLTARGNGLSEAQMLLLKAQALRGELEAIMLTLTEEEFNATGPDEGDWSMRQLVEHVRDTDRNYLGNVRRALETARSAAPA